jgi:hypothetical protein
VKLTQAQRESIARKANFYFDVNFNYKFQDSVVFTGDGVPDLDRLISIMAAGTQHYATFLADVGSQYSVYRPFDLEDLVSIRQMFIDIYGNVSRPNVYTRQPSVTIQLPSGSVAASSGATNVAE